MQFEILRYRDLTSFRLFVAVQNVSNSFLSTVILFVHGEESAFYLFLALDGVRKSPQFSITEKAIHYLKRESMRAGFSMRFFHELLKRATVAPSTTL